MTTSVHGIHHVTCIAGNAQENLDFYVALLGMRLVKKSVNQDDPGTYHLFYADRVGNPGTDFTFFPWANMEPGRLGIGLTVETSFAVAPGSLAYWQERFAQHGVAYGAPESRFGETTLSFQDPHGLQLALVETRDEREFVPWENSPVSPEHQLKGMHAVRLWERGNPTFRFCCTSTPGHQTIRCTDEPHARAVRSTGRYQPGKSFWSAGWGCNRNAASTSGQCCSARWRWRFRMCDCRNKSPRQFDRGRYRDRDSRVPL
jgi:glyoxalase family protein